MYSYSSRSKQKLSETHRLLQEVFNEVIKHFDNTILVGHRNNVQQTFAYNEGRSKLKWPNSRHNSIPSTAIDVAPYPINWEDRERFTYFAGYVKGIATSKGINLRWGGDWNSDTEVTDNSFDDLVHFELVE